MEFALNSSTIYCKHCSTIVPSVRGDGFCCNGCEAVYQILTRAGLSEYYRIKENAVCYQKPKPATLIKQKFDFVSNSSQVKFYLEGIHCTACVWLLEKLPMIMPEAVVSCFLNLNTSVLSITLKK